MPLGRYNITALVDIRGKENFISQSFIKDI
jgi:hypothetical protein